MAETSQDQALNLACVSQQRELLLAFCDYIFGDELFGIEVDIDIKKRDVEGFLKANNCG